jgi:phosphomannomutase
LFISVIGMNLEPTGIFAHKPEPLPENLGDLCSRVVAESADMGKTYNIIEIK